MSAQSSSICGAANRLEIYRWIALAPRTTREIIQHFSSLHRTTVYKHLRRLYSDRLLYISGWEAVGSRPRGLRIPRFALNLHAFDDVPHPEPADVAYPEIFKRSPSHQRKPGVKRTWGYYTPRASD